MGIYQDVDFQLVEEELVVLGPEANFGPRPVWLFRRQPVKQAHRAHQIPICLSVMSLTRLVFWLKAAVRQYLVSISASRPAACSNPRHKILTTAGNASEVTSSFSACSGGNLTWKDTISPLRRSFQGSAGGNGSVLCGLPTRRYGVVIRSNPLRVESTQPSLFSVR